MEHLRLASEMFALLDQTYGDPATATCIIVNKLQNLTLSKKPEYEKILELTMIINRNAYRRCGHNFT